MGIKAEHGTSGTLLPRAFYRRPMEVVARDLIGRHLCHGPVTLSITEVEAYGGEDDTASHCRSGRTLRNAPMWEEGGCAYVYLCYGLHHMLNVVTGAAGEGSGVLIRACEPVTGLELIQARRPGARGTALLAGPGRVAQALGLDLTFNGHALYRAGGLELREGRPVHEVLCGARVGIPFADACHREALLRFASAESAWVTERAKLVRA